MSITNLTSYNKLPPKIKERYENDQKIINNSDSISQEKVKDALSRGFDDGDAGKPMNKAFVDLPDTPEINAMIKKKYAFGYLAGAESRHGGSRKHKKNTRKVRHVKKRRTHRRST